MALYFNTHRVHIVVGTILTVLSIANCALMTYYIQKMRQKAPIYIECDQKYIEGVGRYVDALNRVRDGLK